jgi:hypothetical protein
VYAFIQNVGVVNDHIRQILPRDRLRRHGPERLNNSRRCAGAVCSRNDAAAFRITREFLRS